MKRKHEPIRTATTPEEQIQYWSEIIASNPNNTNVLADSFRLRGDAYLQLGKYNEAIADYQQAKKFNPIGMKDYTKFGEAHRKLGWEYIKAGQDTSDEDFVQGHQHFDAALEINPEDEMAYAWHGEAYYQQAINYTLQREKHKELSRNAILTATKAIEINPTFADAYCLRGDVHWHAESSPIKILWNYFQDLRFGSQESFKDVERFKFFQYIDEAIGSFQDLKKILLEMMGAHSFTIRALGQAMSEQLEKYKETLAADDEKSLW